MHVKRVKLFEASEGYGFNEGTVVAQLETKVNEWMAEHPWRSVNVESIATTYVATEGDGGILVMGTATIVYTKYVESIDSVEARTP